IGITRSSVVSWQEFLFFFEGDGDHPPNSLNPSPSEPGPAGGRSAGEYPRRSRWSDRHAARCSPARSIAVAIASATSGSSRRRIDTPRLPSGHQEPSELRFHILSEM